MTKNQDIRRLNESFDFLKQVSGDISCVSTRVPSQELNDDELALVAVYCQLAAELRGLVLRYRPDIEALNGKGVRSMIRDYAACMYGGAA